MSEEAAANKAAAPTYPAVGKVFELTIDFNALENQPLEMIRRDGYNPEGWRYTGKNLTGVHTRSFKLVQVGYCSNFEELRQKLLTHGEIPEGHWRQAFKAAFPRPDGKGPIGIPDFSWMNRGGYLLFPYVSTDGHSCFFWPGFGFVDDWRWLVACTNT